MNDRLTFAGTIAVDGRRLKGAVRIAGHQTPRDGELVEVDLDALHRADRKGAVLVVGHQAFGEDGYDPLRTVARLDNNTLRITPTRDGFTYETDELPNTTYANDALELARAGVFGGTSFDIFGLRSKVRIEPGNVRVRRYTSIAKFGAVTPVVDPAFPSTVVAFSKESDVAEETTPEAPAPEAAPAKREPAKFSAGGETADSPKTGKAYWAEFAGDLETSTIAGQMDAMFSLAKGDLRGEVLDRYEGFGEVLRERKRTEARARARIEAMEFEHNARMGRVPAAPEVGLYQSDDYKAAFSQYIRHGDKSVMAQFAQSIAGDGTQGGFTVPEDFLNKVTETRAAYGGIQQIAEVLTTGDGRALPWPTNDDTGNSAAIANEGSAPGSGGADLVFGEASLGAFSIAATGTGNAPLKVSWELLQDTAIDFDAFIARKLGERLGRKAAAYYATGVGTTEPLGLLAKTPDAMTATTMFAALVEHHFQVNSAYRESGNCNWVMSDTTLAKVYNSVDLQGRPLFIPAAEASGAGRPAGLLIGYPVRLDQGAGDLVAFGDIRAGYIIRIVRGVQVVVDPYNNTASRQTAYHAWMRTDATIQDSAAYSVSDYSTVSADAAS